MTSKEVNAAADAPHIHIEPSHGWISLNLSELWAYRELLYFLIWRDMKVRYKQTVLGSAWAIIQPLSTMVVFTVVFGRLAHIPSEGVPYPVFSFAALVPWTFFTSGLTRAASSMVNNSNLIKKVYFPRLVMPVAGALAGIVDFCIAFVALLGMMIFYHITPTFLILWIPLFLGLAWITALGVGIWLSAMNVQFRDVGYIVPFLTQFWLYATPVAYPSSLLQEPWRTLYAINPMVGVIDGFRWSLLGAKSAPSLIIVVSTLTALIILISGAYYFRRTEKTFADVV